MQAGFRLDHRDNMSSLMLERFREQDFTVRNPHKIQVTVELAAKYSIFVNLEHTEDMLS